MLYSFQQKNILIIPLAAFIRFNKKMAGERLANLFGLYFDDLLACEEELEEHEKFCEKLLEKILFSKIVADFNLGKKNKQEFISEALKFLNLTSDKASAFESAWNCLLEFDKELHDVFNELIKLTQHGQSIYFIGNTNELHAQKVLALFKKISYENFSWLENLPSSTGDLPFALIETSQARIDGNAFPPSKGNVYFFLSYLCQNLIEQPSNILTQLFTPFQPTSGLLCKLSAYLMKQGKPKEDILLINPYRNINAITKKLAQETISKNNFYSELRDSASEAMQPLSGLRSIDSPLARIEEEHISLLPHP